MQAVTDFDIVVFFRFMLHYVYILALLAYVYPLNCGLSIFNKLILQLYCTSVRRRACEREKLLSDI